MNKIAKTLIAIIIGSLAFGSFASIATAETSRERAKRVRVEYQQARAQYQKEVEFYRQARQDFLSALGKYVKNKNADDLTLLESDAKEFLTSAVGTLVKRLESVKVWVNYNRGFTEGERAGIIAELDEDIAWLNEQPPLIEAASLEGIKAKAKELRAYWDDHRVLVKRIVGQLMAGRINFVLNSAHEFEGRIEEHITTLKTTGADVAHIEELFTSFKDNLALAEEKYIAAKEKFNAISSLDNAHVLFGEGYQFIQSAHQYARDAHGALLEILREGKKLTSAAASAVSR